MNRKVFGLTLLVSLLTCISLYEVAQEAAAKRPRSRVAVEVKFIQFVSNQYHTYAQYKVTNTGTQVVRFPGSATNSNWLMVTKRGALIQQGPRIDGTHWFGSYSLSPGQSIRNDLQLPDGDEPFQIGFGYETGQNHVWKFAWSEMITPPPAVTRSY